MLRSQVRHLVLHRIGLEQGKKERQSEREREGWGGEGWRRGGGGIKKVGETNRLRKREEQMDLTLVTFVSLSGSYETMTSTSLVGVTVAERRCLVT